MGSFMSSVVRSDLRESQERQVTAMKSDMISQQVELARRMAERQMALQVASVRELMLWFVPFALTSYAFLYRGYRNTNSWVVMFPLIPVTFGFAYQLHYAYGNKTAQIRALAEKIMANEAHMMAVPEWQSTDQFPLSPSDPSPPPALQAHASSQAAASSSSIKETTDAKTFHNPNTRSV
ncbi:plasminogen receptor (KT)-like isoform X1 [Penaeus indicus]|uniref:plasminogen receptor (KT)-like isoform X1 n=1 Tax=Penaeus indicus TaxID=29960 RepID=UPI00300C69D4